MQATRFLALVCFTCSAAMFGCAGESNNAPNTGAKATKVAKNQAEQASPTKDAPKDKSPPKQKKSASEALAQQVQAVFDKYCVRCHGRSGGLNLKKGQAFKNLIGVESKGYAPKIRVTPGKPEESVLYHKLLGTEGYGRRMPRTGKLPDDKIKLIKRWIESLENE